MTTMHFVVWRRGMEGTVEGAKIEMSLFQSFPSHTFTGMGSFKAIKSLLRGAKELESTGPTRTFVKSGDYIQASKDFNRAHPTDRQAYQLPGGVGRKSGSNVVCFLTKVYFASVKAFH